MTKAELGSAKLKEVLLTKLYKITNQNGYTRRGAANELLWGPGVSHTATGEGEGLCTDGVIHAYRSALLAIFMNPAHACIADPLIWESEGDVVADDGTKVGAKVLTTLVPLPAILVTLEQRVTFGVLAAKQVCFNPGWVEWADLWLSGVGRPCLVAPPIPYPTTHPEAVSTWVERMLARTARAAYAAAHATESTYAASEAAHAAEEAAHAAAAHAVAAHAAKAVHEATYAASEAAYAEEATAHAAALTSSALTSSMYAAKATDAETEATYAAARAARVSAHAAGYATEGAPSIDLVAVAEAAMVTRN